ncbi:hypothetical protein K435DRAFT_799766 [Dendrothele bispora CBS 962.96]|uniref:Uncharacterized protein n=1 Tax=Dendrothele bispora (strain CBS 962.96) TaxID=1314807 RepID=A0A4S8LUX3_DENBC|nr:hypothetical protein K435DRAFT_799766 [Dendrothele bispora CBS 962.96]
MKFDKWRKTEPKWTVKKNGKTDQISTKSTRTLLWTEACLGELGISAIATTKATLEDFQSRRAEIDTKGTKKKGKIESYEDQANVGDHKDSIQYFTASHFTRFKLHIPATTIIEGDKKKGKIESHTTTKPRAQVNLGDLTHQSPNNQDFQSSSEPK